MAAVVCPGPQALRQAEVLRESLKSSVDDFNIGSSGWSSRQMLQDLYKSILLNDLEFALDKKVEQELWNSAFKNQIDFLRQQAKEHKGSKSSDIQAILSLFLEAASGFYIQLLQEICLIYSLDLPGHTKSSHLGILEDLEGGSTAKRPHTQSCYYVCQDCLVHLGDIARYCDDCNQAEVFYKHALVLVPSNGQPYNQLAILASAKGDQLGTVYFYCRSIAVKNQFPAASTNLHKIFYKICSRPCTSIPSNKAEVFNVFLQFHGFMYLDQDFSEARKLKDRIVEGFELLLQQGVLKQDDMIRVSAITLFTLYHIKCGRGVDDLEEFDCISKAEEESWQLCLEFAVNLFDVMITYINGENDSASCPTMVYVSVFCQWMASNSSVWKEDMIKTVLIWEKFAILLNRLSTSVGHPLDKSDVPLCEDWELYCFAPLYSFQKKLNFTIKKTKVDDEDVHRTIRLLHFGNQLSNYSPRILSKVDDIPTGLAKFSLRTDTNATDNVNTSRSGVQEQPLKLPRDFTREAATGQQPSSLPNPAFLPKKSPSPTPFIETSSLFNNSSHGAIGGPVERPSFLATPQVAQYSLFQSGWKAPLTTAFGTTGSSHSSPIERPPHDLSPIGHTYSNPGTLSGTPGEYHPPEYHPPGGGIPPFQQGAPRPQGFSTPSPGPLDGFGLSENWGTGVWGPAKTSTTATAIPAPTQQVQSMWSQDLSPGQGLSPLQQLLHDQQKRKDHNGT